MNVYSASQHYAHLMPLLGEKTNNECIQNSLRVLKEHLLLVEKHLSHPPLNNYFQDCVIPLQKKGEISGVGAKARLARTIYANLLQKIYSKVMGKHFLPSQSILEIGAGQQTSMLSHSSSKFTNWIASDFTYEPAEGMLARKKIQLDITQAPPADLLHHFDGIVGNNVLDTLAYRDLSVAFENMGKLLKEEGMVVHFADLSFLAEAFVDACGDAENCVLLPAGPQIKHMYRIDKADYEQVLRDKKNELTDEEWAFLSEWGQKSTQMQVAVLSRVQSVDFIHLAERVKKIFENSTMIILDNQALFEKHLKESTQTAGWEIIQCTYSVDQDLKGKTKGDHFNHHCFKQGDSIGSNHSSVPEGKMMYEAYVHVFIAKRKRMENQDTTPVETHLEGIEGKLADASIHS